MSRGSPRHPARLRLTGFSLVELSLVIAIVAVMGAVALPRYERSLDRYRADAAAKRVVAELDQIAVNASVTSLARTVVFTAGSGQFTVSSSGAVERTVDLTVEPYSATVTAASLGGDASLVYSGYGTPDSGGTITLKSGATTRTVTVSAVTGKATFQ
jgi:prepilin-type N-terminal cleavage/methylation domain-containing protein